MECRLCNSTSLSLYYSQGNNDEFEFYRCTNCGLVNYDMERGLDQKKYENALSDPVDFKANKWKKNEVTFQFITRNIRKKSCRSFEIGCGYGRLLHRLRDYGWDVSGLDLSPNLARYIKEKLDIDIHAGNFLEYDQRPGEKYDVVILRHVLEHLPDSIGAMKKIHSLLDTGGIGVLEFPNIDGWDLRMKRTVLKLGLRKKRYPQDYHPGHCNEFNRRSFEFLIDKTGFDLLKWETYSSKPTLGWLYRVIPVGSKVRTIIKKR